MSGPYLPRRSARASISSLARDGTTFAAPGSIENSPTVAAKWNLPLLSSVPQFLDPPTSRAAVVSASWREPIGVVRQGRPDRSYYHSYAGDPRYRRHHADNEMAILQHRPLLDMQFDEGGDILALLDFSGIAADLGDPLRKVN